MQLIVFKFDYILLLRSVSVVAEFVRPSVCLSVFCATISLSVRPLMFTSLFLDFFTFFIQLTLNACDRGVKDGSRE